MNISLHNYTCNEYMHDTNINMIEMYECTNSWY